ncbi:aspartate/glutamate racemase family protein [Thioclava sp. BHET1]|nr:aspartate/glutamate racemase family protein [Thioclava sp. BHET1]
MSGFIGILSLDTGFPRILGDAGNPDSYPLPARLRVVRGADSTAIVKDGRPSPELIAGFCQAAEDLAAEGASVITSTCGFLITVQQDIAARVSVPVVLSSLCLLPFITQLTGGRPVGILTASAPSLGETAIRAAGSTPERVRIVGLEGSALFARTFLARKGDQNSAFDRGEMEAEVLAAAADLVTRAPEIGAVLLECGNLPPYAAAIAARIGKPVFSILDAVACASGR